MTGLYLFLVGLATGGLLGIGVMALLLSLRFNTTDTELDPYQEEYHEHR
ncbi:MAG: hypothetical protein Q7U98_17065 [Methylicorpusculum sp.]|nr:hypothetical protein [Methylicorpusculum sp.]MDO8940867.1 hypothetical protein [Methylicorpusculum sp.]MDP2202441.1 hypothetical protein [Methylicorpusculum sp.]